MYALSGRLGGPAVVNAATGRDRDAAAAALGRAPARRTAAVFAAFIIFVAKASRVDLCLCGVPTVGTLA